MRDRCTLFLQRASFINLKRSPQIKKTLGLNFPKSVAVSVSCSIMNSNSERRVNHWVHQPFTLLIAGASQESISHLPQDKPLRSKMRCVLPLFHSSNALYRWSIHHWGRTNGNFRYCRSWSFRIRWLFYLCSQAENSERSPQRGRSRLGFHGSLRLW